MGFWPAISSCFNQYVTFSGRAPRSEFWFWCLFTWLVSIGLTILDAVLFGLSDDGLGPLSGLFSLAVLLPGLAVSARRLHDIERSGWWMLVYLVPLVGWVLFFVWNCRRGSIGTNRFGMDPLAGSMIPPAMPPTPPPMQ